MYSYSALCLRSQPTKHILGDCIKTRKHTYDVQGEKILGVFMWAGKSYDDFEPRKTPVDRPAQDSL